MNTGKLIEEIVPWLVIAGMYLPYIIKKLRKKNAARPAARPSQHKAAPSRTAQTVNRAFTELFNISDFETTTTAPPASKPKPAPELPEEGVRAVADMPPMQPVDEHPRATGARRDLRRAYLLGEILQKKF